MNYIYMLYCWFIVQATRTLRHMSLHSQYQNMFLAEYKCNQPHIDTTAKGASTTPPGPLRVLRTFDKKKTPGPPHTWYAYTSQ